MRTDDYADFAEFVVSRQHALHRAAYLMLGDVALAEDLVQEALAKTYARWAKVRSQGNPEAYVRKVITTTAISWFRRKGWGERPSESLPDREITGPADGIVDGVWLAAALQQLPARQRVAVVLRFYEDLTEAQTAEVMGCAVGTVKSQVSAALTKLRLDPSLAVTR